MSETKIANPYLNARRSWNSHMSSAMNFGVLGLLGGLICLLIALVAIAGIIYIGSQSKFVPLVFQQDSTGNTISMTRADRIPDAKVDDYRLAIADFITHIRLITPDAELQSKAIWRAYAYLATNDPATTKANEYLNAAPEANPFTRATKETVGIELKSVLQQSLDTWQVDWVETIRTRDGSLKQEPYVMRALVTIYQNLKADVSSTQMFTNPHFIFIQDFNWSRQL